ncbi:hypothetical protein QWY87_13560 [Lutimonas halocynthiae]|uniref:hypothetical protein n=1 Tax=Lutimonas halocynthiae TaxID=1446477 RepID=UPI0025B512F6|nr:hypothetical protein [Lutimonas halocynthiae]MDN3643738.1 hypothetical protein [Lutimonas halocynthiae]
MKLSNTLFLLLFLSLITSCVKQSDDKIEILSCFDKDPKDLYDSFRPEFERRFVDASDGEIYLIVFDKKEKPIIGFVGNEKVSEIRLISSNNKIFTSWCNYFGTDTVYKKKIDVRKEKISYQLYAERGYSEEGGLEYVMGIQKVNPEKKE